MKKLLIFLFIGFTITGYGQIKAPSGIIYKGMLLTPTAPELNILHGSGVNAEEFKTLDGILVNKDELNRSIGVNAPIQAQLDQKVGDYNSNLKGTTNTEALIIINPSGKIDSTKNDGSGLKIFQGDKPVQVYIPPENRLSGYTVFAAKHIIINPQTGSYQLQSTDDSKLITMNVASANNLTVPLASTASFAPGTIINVSCIGAGKTTVVVTGGVTVYSKGSLLGITILGDATLINLSEDTWKLIGSLE